MPLTKEFTISYLVNPNTINKYTSMVFSPVSTDEGLNIADNWGGNSFPTVRLWGSSDADTYLDNFISAADGLCNQWSYITLTCDANGTFNLYVDGEKADGDKTNAAIAADLAGKEIFLGVNYWDVSFDGLMDEVRIYDRALTESDIAGLCETVGITVEPGTPSGPDEPEGPTEPSDPTPDTPVQPGDWPDVTELNCEAFWGVHTKGIAVGNDGVTVKFSNKTNGTNNWNTPIYVIYTGDEAKVGGAGYVEYGVMRSDAYGWDGAGKTGTMAWKAGTDPIDWAGWLATNQAGAEYEISAIRKEDTVFMKINAGGLITYVAIPVKEGKTAYLSLTGEQCKLENISKAGYVSFEVPDELASVAPEKPKPLAPYPVVLPTPEPVPTLPPADENSEGIEMDFAAFWSAHLPGVEITESGTALTYKNETHSSATGNYQVPFVVAYAGDEAKVNGAGYDEYAVIRADSYAWTTKGADANTGDGLAAWNNAGFNFQTNATADTWNSWVADNKAGLTGKIQAIKANGKIYIEFTNGSVRTLTSFAAPEGKKVYFSLAGEECKISNIKPAAYTAIDGINANPAETPAPSADPSASPDPAATAEPGSTATPGTTDPTDPGTNPGDKDPGTTDPGTDNPAENPSDDDDKKDNETKKTMKVSGITAKAGKKKVTGTLSVKGTKVTVKIGSKKAKNAKVNGKKFTFTASSKLKKGTKVTIKVTKSGYKAVTKTVKVK